VDACWEQSLIAGEEFQHILRVLNTNVDGRQKIMFALTSIKGVGRRFANLVCKKADVDMSKRCVWRHDCFFSPLHSRDMMEVGLGMEIFEVIAGDREPPTNSIHCPHFFRIRLRPGLANCLQRSLRT
jgi:hypothetical protein